MGWKLFLDDWRSPRTPGFIVARSFEEAIEMVNSQGCAPYHVAFDYDLGGVDKKTGLDFALWLIDKDREEGGSFLPERFTFSCHSAAADGKKCIVKLMSKYLKSLR